jgi:hypothetical protein
MFFLQIFLAKLLFWNEKCEFNFFFRDLENHTSFGSGRYKSGMGKIGMLGLNLIPICRVK